MHPAAACLFYLNVWKDEPVRVITRPKVFDDKISVGMMFFDVRQKGNHEVGIRADLSFFHQGLRPGEVLPCLKAISNSPGGISTKQKGLSFISLFERGVREHVFFWIFFI